MAGFTLKGCFATICLFLFASLATFHVEFPAVPSYWNDFDVLSAIAVATNDTTSTNIAPIEANTTEKKLFESEITSDTNINDSSKMRSPLRVIILTMNRFESLQRLVQSLQATDYQGDQVDLLIRFDVPKVPTDQWRESVESFRSNLQWNVGNFEVSIAPENMGLRRAWLEAWRPKTYDERAIIFEDDVEVSALWYKWLMGSYDAYQDRSDMAGFSLQRQMLVPHKQYQGKSSIPDNYGRPFLYKLVGSIGYAPVATKWLEFLDFADCALKTQISVETPDLITSDWYKNLDQTGMWTQLFIYFCDYYQLYTLYAFPNGNLALAAHWREKGEHFGKTEGRDFDLVGRSSQWSLDFPSNLPKLDWNAKPAVETQVRTLVLSAAVGYKYAEFERYLTSLRSHYKGEDVSVLVYEGAESNIFELLEMHNVQVVKTPELGGDRSSAGWLKINTIRWQFYQDQCQTAKYDLCMAIDFRDSLFQDHPFRNMEPTKAGESVLHLYQHNLMMNDWHLERAMKCKGHNQQLKNKKIVNAGGFIASPGMFPQLAQWIAKEASNCDDQVALNLAVYGDRFHGDIILHPQGQGSINNVAWGGKFTLDSRGRFLNLNCLPAPAVHQFDLAET